jgi:hypothetical protein
MSVTLEGADATPCCECSPGMACLVVVNHLGSRLTFSVGTEGTAREAQLEPGSRHVLQLPPGDYDYTVSAFGGCDWFEFSHSGTITMEAGRPQQLAFTVECDYWREDNCCVGPSIVLLP